MKIINFIKFTFYYFKGLLLIKNHHSDKAIDCFIKALKLFSTKKYIVFNCNKYIGVGYCYKNQFEEAKAYLLKALEIHTLLKEQTNIENDSEIFGFLGLVYDAESDLHNAKECYGLAIKNYKKYHLTDINYIKHRLNKINEFI